MKCQIQWVDPLSGIPTPDTNDAVALIVCDQRGIGPSQPLACCAAHLERMPVGHLFARDDPDWCSEWKVLEWLNKETP